MQKKIELHQIGFGYDENYLFQDISGLVKLKDKIAIIGDNGVGKSTLLKCVDGTLQTKGKVSIVGDVFYLGQEDNLFDGNIAEYLKEYEDWEIEMALEKLKIEKSINTKIEEMSFGEKLKLQFVKITLGKPDFLLLDEPTNHLDKEGLKWLEEFLKNYNGGIVFVSHHRGFVDAIANKIWFLHNGKMDIFGGNYTFFLEQRKIMAMSLKKEMEVDKKELKQYKRDLSVKESKNQQGESKYKKLQKSGKHITGSVKEYAIEKAGQFAKMIANSKDIINKKNNRQRRKNKIYARF